MTQTKYFVIYYGVTEAEIQNVCDCLNDAREKAERLAVAYPGKRFLITTETQSVVVQTQVNWTDK
jgi:hypothetical protein